MPPRKLYCYVDETGQDTKGTVFIVSVVATGVERDDILALCESLEATSKKGRSKWIRTEPARRISYIRQVFQEPLLQGKFHVRVGHNIQDYPDFTVRAIASVIHGIERGPYKATVLYDGLPRSQERLVGASLRRLGIHTEKVRGVKDENDSISRLADAICGFARAAKEGQPELVELYERNKRLGFIHEEYEDEA